MNEKHLIEKLEWVTTSPSIPNKFQDFIEETEIEEVLNALKEGGILDFEDEYS